MKTIDKLVEIVSETLEPNITFANGGYGDNVHHQFVVTFPELLSYLAIYVVMPVLTGCAGSYLHDLIKVRGGNLARLGVKTGNMHVIGTKEFIDDNIITMDELIEIQKKSSSSDDELANTKVDVNNAEAAQIALSQFLVSNGWPSKIASMNSKRIISRIIEISQ